MSVKKHLFIGFGKLASRCAERLSNTQNRVYGIARSERNHDQNVELWVGDVKSDDILARLSAESFDSVVIILTPDDYTQEAYEQTYLHTIEALVQIWRARPPGRIVFVSSTSVYGQNNGECVNENSDASPSRPTAKVLRDAETLLLESFEESVVIRFSGIYGNGRDYLLRQVWAKKPGDENYTNRIHEDDCVGVICHVVNLEKTELKRLYLASDSSPVTSKEIRAWLAKKMGVDLPPSHKTPSQSARAGNKRCDNTLLLDSGYRFNFPTFKEGYETAVEEFKRAQLGMDKT